MSAGRKNEAVAAAVLKSLASLVEQRQKCLQVAIQNVETCRFFHFPWCRSSKTN